MSAPQTRQISTHSPRVGRTHAKQENAQGRNRFQLTRPVWGEPTPQFWQNWSCTHFNSLAPCGANLARISFGRLKTAISTHSPRVGRTLRFASLTAIVKNFNSLAPCGANLVLERNDGGVVTFQLTRPVWGEPYSVFSSSYSTGISTHSPRVGRTTSKIPVSSVTVHFNSLAPCGANHNCTQRILGIAQFQLTRPVWGEPNTITLTATIVSISTHSPRVGRTGKAV